MDSGKVFGRKIRWILEEVGQNAVLTLGLLEERRPRSVIP